MLQLSPNAILPTYYSLNGFQKILKIPLYSTTNFYAVIEISWKYIIASESYEFLKQFCTQQ